MCGARGFLQRTAFLAAVAIGSSLIPGIFEIPGICSDSPLAGKRASNARLLADLDHDDYRRRSAAMTALLKRPSRDVQPLLKAAGGNPELRWRAKRVLVTWATANGDAHHGLVVAALSGGKTAPIAEILLNDAGVRQAHAARRKRQLRVFSQVAVALLRHGHNRPAIAQAQQVVRIAQRYGARFDEATVTDLLLPRLKPDGADPEALSEELGIKRHYLAKWVAMHFLKRSRRALKIHDLENATHWVLAARRVDVAYGFFEDRPEVILAEIQQLRRIHSQDLAIGVMAAATFRRHLVRQKYRRELAARWKDRFLWPVRTFATGFVLPLYSSDPDRRARQLIFHSEDLQHVPEIWERAWAAEMPDVATPYRVHGGVISFEDVH